jgi:predicted nucleotidyltransferase
MLKAMVSMEQILAAVERIVAAFRPEKVILFGSYAYGQPSEDSDVDLLVVTEFEGKARDKAVEIWCAARPKFATDIVVRRPDEVAQRYREFDPLIREAIDRGRVLHE